MAKKMDKKIWYLIALFVAVMVVGALSTSFLLVPPGGTAYTGDKVIFTFTLKNRDTIALPASTYDTDADGIPDTRILLYKGYKLFDTIGNPVTTGCDTPDGSCNFVTEVCAPGACSIAVNGVTSITLNFSISASTPSSYDGSPYGASGMLFKVTQKWNRTDNTWTETPITLDSPTTNSTLAFKFNVKTQTPPPSPNATTIGSWFTALFTAIWNAIKTLLGW